MVDEATRLTEFVPYRITPADDGSLVRLVEGGPVGRVPAPPLLGGHELLLGWILSR